MATITSTTNPDELARIAAQSPEAWDEILAHPACYPELREWITTSRDSATDAGAPSSPAMQRPAGPASATLVSILLGVGIGVVVGVVLSALLILVVLPGLLGSVGG